MTMALTDDAAGRARADFPIDLTAIARGEVSDGTLRALTRYGLARELNERMAGGKAAVWARKRAFVDELRKGPIAVEQDAANAQHYEVSPAFFELCLGKRRKYSCCYFEHEGQSLDDAEVAMLSRSVEMAKLENGQRILELGCGWGSLTLYMAERFPASTIVAVSNSNSQRESITRRAKQAGLHNVRVVTADITTWPGDGKFDRVVSVEMLEHMRNYEVLFGRIASWLEAGGLFFAHVFAHRELAYSYDLGWMARRFFTGGTMPSVDLFAQFDKHLRVIDTQVIDGTHYQRTSEAWLANLDAHRDAALDILRGGRGVTDALQEFAEWRLFYLITAESFGFRAGQEWVIAHYLFEAKS